jgi:hypothetical protein
MNKLSNPETHCKTPENPDRYAKKLPPPNGTKSWKNMSEI